MLERLKRLKYWNEGVVIAVLVIAWIIARAMVPLLP